MTVKDYTLTQDEFLTVYDALTYAEENAVHREGRYSFRNVKRLLLKQDQEREARKIAEEADDAE